MVAPEVDDKTRQHHTPRNIHIMSTTSSQDSSIINVKSFAPMVAGLSGGCVSTCLLLPLDNIKVRMQVNEDKRSRPHGTHFESIRIFRGILRHEGFVGLYQGLGPALLGSGISWGGYFFLYETFKKQYRSYKAAQSLDTTLSSLDNFKLACSAGTVMVFVTNPLWLIKLRIQLQMKRSSQNLNLELTQKPYTGIFDAARTIVKEEGVTALYKGMGPALMMTSHGGIQFVCYEFLKKEFNYKRPVRDTRDGYQSILERLEKSLGFLSIGAVSKIVASTTTYPLQVLKARLQQRSEQVELTPEGDVRVVKREYRGIVKTVRRIFEKEGLWGFFKGAIPNAIRVAPSAAITFVTYESVMDALSD